MIDYFINLTWKQDYQQRVCVGQNNNLLRHNLRFWCGVPTFIEIWIRNDQFVNVARKISANLGLQV